MTHACFADEALAALLIAAERLADAVDDYREIADDSPEPEHYKDADEFLHAMDFHQEDCEAADAMLVRALHSYRYAQERELCARAVVGINGGQRSTGSPTLTHPAAAR